MSKVELRLTEVEPPAPDPPRTIYTDLVNLPDPARLGLTCRIFNYDDVGLYMRVDGYKTGWTFTTNDFGLLGSGANMYRNLDNFGSRAKPAAELTETITLRLRAYTDSGYTNLKWTFERSVTVVFVNSADPSYTVDVLNNFDDGTVQGWAYAAEVNIDASSLLAVATDYVLSAPYSLRFRGQPAVSGEARARIYKSFTTPNKDVVYAIIDLRVTDAVTEGAVSILSYSKYKEIRRDTTILIHLGRTYDEVAENYVPMNKWMREVVPLPKNVTVEVRIVLDWVGFGAGLEARNRMGLRMDDFKIISK